MKITAFDALYPNRLGGGDTILVSSSGSNSGYSGGDVLGEPGDLSVVGLRSTVALSSNLAAGAAIGDVLSIIQTAGSVVARFSTPSNSGSSGLGWFNVTTYGAVHDGATDDTASVQAAIDACESAGGGVVYFPNGDYKIAGALQDTGRSNAQILLPRRHVTDGTEQITIHLLGETAPPAIPYISGSSTDPNNGPVLRSTLSAGTGSVVGAWGPAGSYLDFSLVRVIVENLTIRTVADPTNSGLDLSHIEACELRNVMVDAGEYTMGSISAQTTASSYGLKLPGNNNGASTFLSGVVNVVGFYNGILVGEHTVADNVQVWAARYAYRFPSAYHASHFSRAANYHCQRGLVFDASRHYLTISQYDVEHAASGTWVTTYDVDDASNYGYGHLAWHVILEVTGYSSTFTVNGGAQIHTIEIGSNPYGSGSPSGSAGGDLSGTYPNPTVAKVNGITVAGSPSAGQVLTATSGTAAGWSTPASGASSRILLADGHATPFTFNDLLQADDGSDFLWSD